MDNKPENENMPETERRKILLRISEILQEQGLISEEEKRRMKAIINEKTSF